MPMPPSRIALSSILVVLAATAAACGSSKAEPTRAITVPLEARSGSTVSGSARLAQNDGHVAIEVNVKGATPGAHGVHLHERADCSSPDAESAGAHYNPGAHAHGLPGAPARHIGDLGNLQIASDGTGKLQATIDGATLAADGATTLLGRAVVIHAQPDDGTQPSGNSGARVGCGEITNPK